MGKTGYVFRPRLPKHIVYLRKYSDFVSLDVLPSTEGAASSNFKRVYF